jgi:hypothetical protein
MLMPFRYLIRKQKQQGEKMDNAQELKAHLQDSNKARMYEEKKKQIKNSPNHYETHSRKYVEKMVCDFINDNQIMAHYGKDKQGIFEVRFEVKDE